MRRIVACTVMAAVLASAPVLEADPAAEVKLAEDLAQQAFAAHERGEYDAAIALYERAYQTSASGVILFNIANIYDKKLKNKEQALEYYRRYLRSGDSEPELVRRASERIDVVRAELAAAAEPEVAPAPPPPAPQPSAPQALVAIEGQPETVRSRSWRAAAVVTGAAGLVGLGLGGVYGYLAKSRNDDAAELCMGNACPDQRGVDLTDDARQAATISTAAVIAGSLLVAGGVAMYLYAPRQERRSGKVSLRLGPQVGPSSGGVTLSGAWR
jgi:tetratricopeptide (TPR) repeat protein